MFTPLRRGLIYFCLHVVSLIAILALSRPLMETYGFGEVLFFRNLAPWLAISALMALRPGFHPWTSTRWKGHLVRGFVGFANMMLLYLSVMLLPLALAMTIRQLEAFIWVGLAAFLYREKVSPRQWAALVVGFIGVVLVLHPAVEANVLGTIVAMACAVTGAFVRVLSRELSRTESSETIIFFNFTQWTLLSACMMPWTWSMPRYGDWLSLLLVGVLIFISQWLMTEGMRLVPPPRLAPFRHTEIFWAGLVGWLFWREPLSLWFVAGSALIVVGGIAANWRERRVKPLKGAV